MNLYVVKDGSGKVIQDGFSKKTEAKAARAEFVQQNKATYVVSLGPDHSRFKTKKQSE